MNVTELSLVGSAHPTADQYFWRFARNHFSYFSAIQPRDLGQATFSMSAAVRGRFGKVGD